MDRETPRALIGGLIRARVGATDSTTPAERRRRRFGASVSTGGTSDSSASRDPRKLIRANIKYQREAGMVADDWDEREERFGDEGEEDEAYVDAYDGPEAWDERDDDRSTGVLPLTGKVGSRMAVSKMDETRVMRIPPRPIEEKESAEPNKRVRFAEPPLPSEFPRGVSGLSLIHI